MEDKDEKRRRSCGGQRKPKEEGEKEVCFPLPEGSGKSRHMLNLEGRMEGRVKIEREKLEHFQMEEGKKGWPVVE